MKIIFNKYQLLVLTIILTSCNGIKNNNSSMDKKLRLHDIWALEAVKSESIDVKNYMKHPDLEINLTTNKVMGNDGCNNFTGEIKQVDKNNLSFNALASTRMACPNMRFSDEIGKYLTTTASYTIENLELTLFNAEGDEVLRYKKVD